jgi:hypothetical protein
MLCRQQMTRELNFQSPFTLKPKKLHRWLVRLRLYNIVSNLADLVQKLYFSPVYINFISHDFWRLFFIIIGDAQKYLLSLNIFDLFPIFNIKIALMFLSNYQKLKRYLFLIRQKCLTNLKKNQKKSVSPP